MKTLFLFILFLQGSLHLVKFHRAQFKGNVVKLKNYISKPFGWLWLISGLLFLGVLLLAKSNIEGWPFFAIAAVILSQSLIFLFWNNAKWWTLFNIVITVASLFNLGNLGFDFLQPE